MKFSIQMVNIQAEGTTEELREVFQKIEQAIDLACIIPKTEDLPIPTATEVLHKMKEKKR